MRTGYVCGTVLAISSGFASMALAAGYTAVDLYKLGAPAGFDSTSLFTGGFAPAQGGQVGGTGNGPGTGGQIHAIFWDLTHTNGVDFNPAGAINSRMRGADGAHQVGDATIGGTTHAIVWSGTSASMIDLHPSGVGGTRALGVGGLQQVGDADGHAALWTGSAGSMIDLNPAGYISSQANGVDGFQQVGEATNNDGERHATVWSGSAASAIDLHSATYSQTFGYGVGGGQQVGSGFTAGAFHPLLWSGTAASLVDLLPAGATSGSGRDSNGSVQVGEIFNGTHGRASAWSGSAASWVDLGALLPANWADSFAYNIDPDGTIWGIGFDQDLEMHAVKWTVPEPSSLSLVVLTAAATLSRHRNVSRRQVS